MNFWKVAIFGQKSKKIRFFQNAVSGKQLVLKHSSFFVIIQNFVSLPFSAKIHAYVAGLYITTLKSMEF